MMINVRDNYDISMQYSNKSLYKYVSEKIKSWRCKYRHKEVLMTYKPKDELDLRKEAECQFFKSQALLTPTFRRW